jgi:hypothetical protein
MTIPLDSYCIAIVAPFLLLKIPQPRRVWWEPSIGSILFARARGQEQRDLPMSSRLHSNWADPTGFGPWNFRGFPKHKRAPKHPWTMAGWAQLSFISGIFWHVLKQKLCTRTMAKDPVCIILIDTCHMFGVQCDWNFAKRWVLSLWWINPETKKWVSILIKSQP